MRSKWKGAYCSPEVKELLLSLDEAIEFRREKKKTTNSPEGVKTRSRVAYIYSRGSTILPEFIGKTVNIHNGKEFKNLEIKNEHIGFKFGELAVTKKSPKYKIKSKK